MRDLFFVVCFVVALVSGCASHTDQLVRPSNPTISELEPALSQNASEIKASWWAALGDIQLNTLIERALAHSPSLETAGARIAAAQSIANSQQSTLLPQFGFSAQADKQQLSQNYFFAPGMDTYNGYGLIETTLNWSLDIWGKQRKYFDASLRRIQAAKLNAAAAQLLLTSTVVRVYIDYDRATHLRSINSQELTIRNKLYHIATARQKVGLGEALEVNQRLADKDLAQARLTQSETAVVVFQHQLAALVAQGPSFGEALKPPQIEWGNHDLPKLIPANLLARRPDLQVLLTQIDASELDLAASKLEYLPDVNLQGYVGAQSFGLPLLFQSASQTFSVGPVLSLPIFDGGRISANILGKESARNERISVYQDQLLTALKEAADGIANVKSTDSELEQNKQAQIRADNNLRIQEERKRVGLTTTDNVLNAKLVSVQQLRNVLDSRARLFSAEVSLIQALGGSYQISQEKSFQTQ